MKKSLLVLLSTLTINLSGNQLPDILQKDFKVTLQWLQEKPESYAKDFFIIQYLNQDGVSIENAQKAFEMGQSKNSKVKDAFNKKFKKSVPNKDIQCYRYTTDELAQISDARCIALGLTLSEASQTSKENLKIFISKLGAYSSLQNDLKILYENNVANESLPYGFSKYFDFFFDLGSAYREKNYDKSYSQDFIDKLSNEDDFEKFIRYSVYDKEDLQNLQKSFLNVEDNKKLTSNALFLLGINAAHHQNAKKAFYFFEKSYNKSYLKYDKDKNLFWMYLTTENEAFLYEAAKSTDINLYSTYAKELLEYPIDNVFYTVETKNTPTTFNVYDTFAWNDVLDDTRRNFDEAKFEKYSNIFTDESTLPHLVYMKKRYEKYRNEYFITPYKKELKDLDVYKKTVIYSLGKQESNFIPCSISVSTAQGVMQIMPFLSEDIAKKLGEEYNIYQQFNPETNLRYASYHLDTLMKMFDNNPLFIAYAYNGGAGYTRSQFKKGLFDRIDKKYEPFLSMELISYPETKEYGKKVLTNYYFYNNYLNPENKIELSTIFQSLVVPADQ